MNMLIDGQWVDASNGECMSIRNPGTGEVLEKGYSTFDEAAAAWPEAINVRPSVRRQV